MNEWLFGVIYWEIAAYSVLFMYLHNLAAIFHKHNPIIGSWSKEMAIDCDALKQSRCYWKGTIAQSGRAFSQGIFTTHKEWRGIFARRKRRKIIEKAKK
jgi:hypothetical protein